MIASAFRPSDDATTFSFNIPQNAMLVVELRKLANVLNSIKMNAEAKQCLEMADTVDSAIKQFGIMVFKKVFGFWLFKNKYNLTSTIFF